MIPLRLIADYLVLAVVWIWRLAQVAAVVLGGTAITGGKGSLTGVMLGTLLIVIVQNSMILMGIPTFWQGFALGLLIIVGTGVSALQVMRARRNAH